MQPIPDNIARFLGSNHVVSIGTAAGGNLWSACCFYVADPENTRLIVLTSQKTQHGSQMMQNPKVSGTIAGQPDSITKISGIQFTAHAHCITEPEARKTAAALFYKAHPSARAMKSDVWELLLDTVKFTDNKLVFAQKTLWQREAA